MSKRRSDARAGDLRHCKSLLRMCGYATDIVCPAHRFLGAEPNDYGMDIEAFLAMMLPEELDRTIHVLRVALGITGPETPQAQPTTKEDIK